MKKKLSVGKKDGSDTESLNRKGFYKQDFHKEGFCKKGFHTEEKATAERFKAVATTLVPEREKRGDALKEIRETIREKTIHETEQAPIPLKDLLLIELRHISSSFWIAQGILAGSLVLILKKISEHGGALPDYLCWISVLAAWMGVLGCCSLGRHFSRGMAELEQSCYFNLPQLWTMKMALSGTADILVLALGSGRIAWKTDLPFGQVCLYVMVPFVLSNVCCLLFFTALRGRRGRYGQLVLAFVTGLMAVSVSSLPMEAYGKGSLWAWTAVFSGGIGIYLCQLRYLYGKIRRGEMVCWN